MHFCEGENNDVLVELFRAQLPMMLSPTEAIKTADESIHTALRAMGLGQF
jgi:hypothetical protein